MTVASVVFDEYGGYAYVNGKTGQRRIRFVQAIPYLREYLNVHPHRDDSLCPLWIAHDRAQALNVSTVRRNLRAAALRAGIHKRVWPYLFRHSRLTLNAKFMTEAELCIFAGWEQGSPQTRVYVHLSGEDLDEKILAHYGLKDRADIQKEQVLQPVQCPRCQEANPVTNAHCFHCGSYLTLEKAMEQEQVQVQEIESLKAAHTRLQATIDAMQADHAQVLQQVEELMQSIKRREK